MQHLDPRDQILIDPQAFSWVSQLEVKPAQINVPASLEREIAAPAAHMLSMIDTKLSPPKLARKAVSKKSSVAAAPKRMVRDSIRQTQAAPAQEAVSAEAQLTSELQTMKQMHRALHRGFRVALLSPTQPKATALATQPVLQAKPKPIQQVATQVKKRKAAKKAAPIFVAQTQASKQIEPLPLPRLPKPQKLSDKLNVVMAQATESSEEGANVDINSETRESAIEIARGEISLQPTEANELNNHPESNYATVQSQGAPEQASEGSTDVGSDVPATAAPALAFGYSHGFDYPQPAEKVSDYSPNVLPSTPDPSPLPSPSPTPPALCVQAFHWEAQIDDCYKEHVTQEQGPSGEESGWKIAKAYQHWSSLHWKTSNSVPLLSENTAILLGALLGTKVEPQTGIVFGTLPAGWTAEISARSEGFILDRENKILPSDSTDGVRYFTFLNTAPGTHLLHMVQRKTGKSVAIVVPVISGTSTYIEGAIPTPVTLTGTILDGSASTVAPIAGVTISVVGQEKTKGKTHANGEFVLENLFTLNNYPLFIQSDFEGGYTHRYRVLPGATSSLMLYRLSRHQLDGWMGQLVGGVSPESGLIVGAIPKIVASSEDRLYPSVAPLLSNQTLAPETYTVAPTGQLLVNTELSAESARFVAAQIPDGAVIAQVEDPAQKSIWSELVPVSPGVVNLVGPY